MENKKQVVNDHEAARIIAMSVHFLRQARYREPTGDRTPGPAYYKIGRSIRYNVEDLDTWLTEHRCE